MPGSAFRTKRADNPSKRLDITGWRELLKDGRVWCALGLVQDVPFTVVTDDSGTPLDVLVDLNLAPHGESVQARLGNTGGLWRIPKAGVEVAVLVPLGAWEDADPLIVAELSSNSVPDGLSADTVILRVDPGQRLLVIDGLAGEAKALATADHKHPLPNLEATDGGSTHLGVVEIPGAGSIETGTPDDVTTVLKAK